MRMTDKTSCVTNAHLTLRWKINVRNEKETTKARQEKAIEVTRKSWIGVLEGTRIDSGLLSFHLLIETTTSPALIAYRSNEGWFKKNLRHSQSRRGSSMKRDSP
jgi:hypothetical protein